MWNKQKIQVEKHLAEELSLQVNFVATRVIIWEIDFAILEFDH